MDASSAPEYRARLRALRDEVADRKAEGIIVTLADEHGSEYVGAYAHRLRWLTGFTGTAARAVVLPDRAALFTDGRYAIQSREETDASSFEIGVTPEADLSRWLSEHAAPGATVLFDPWLVSRAALRKWRWALRSDICLKPSAGNLVDSIWCDRPLAPAAPAEVHPNRLAGVSSSEKRAAIASALRGAGHDAVVIAALDSVAWALNLRGRDIAHLPVVRAFLIVNSDASATLFVELTKVNAAVREHLGPGVRVAAYDAFEPALQHLRGKRVAADPECCAEAIFEGLAGCAIVESVDPCVLPRALKNDIEIAGARAAHVRDGVALVRFLHWLDGKHHRGLPNEIEASDMLLRFREQTGRLRELSFATISAAGASSALPHYVAKHGSARRLEPNSLYLVDSGAQYDDGTTDVTRTVVIGDSTEEMRRRFTQALRGHIAIAAGLFPPGTTGTELDPLARQYLWQGGADYATGTGHGVGSFLAVHEGPAFIGKRGGTRPTDEPIRPRMILSDEPGFYLAGAWGLRTENLYLVVGREGRGGVPGWFSFEALTLVPIDRKLIDVDELSRFEREWIDQYHASVRRELIALLGTEEAAWLTKACLPLSFASLPAREDSTA